MNATLTPDVNQVQIGGQHYKTAFEHWDFVTLNRLSYLEGNATKYLSRAEKKAGLQDYQKALHYVRKIVSVRNQYVSGLSRSQRWLERWFPMAQLHPVCSPAAYRHEFLQGLDDFLDYNQVPPIPGTIIHTISDWQTEEDLSDAEGMLSEYICQRWNLSSPV